MSLSSVKEVQKLLEMKMDWLSELETEHALFDVAEECKKLMAESYYLLISDQQQGNVLDD